jgi:hypothetical protein
MTHLRPLLLLPVVFLLSTGCLARTSKAQPSSRTEVLTDAAKTDAANLRPAEVTFAGTAVGSPAQPARHEVALDVPAGAIGVRAVLSWSGPFAMFTLVLVDPDGEVRARGVREPGSISWR